MKNEIPIHKGKLLEMIPGLAGCALQHRNGNNYLLGDGREVQIYCAAPESSAAGGGRFETFTFRARSDLSSSGLLILAMSTHIGWLDVVVPLAVYQEWLPELRPQARGYDLEVHVDRHWSRVLLPLPAYGPFVLLDAFVDRFDMIAGHPVLPVPPERCVVCDRQVALHEFDRGSQEQELRSLTGYRGWIGEIVPANLQRSFHPGCDV